MAYAQHTNTDVQHQLRMGLIPTPLPILLGEFNHAETGVHFEYAERRWHTDDFAPEMPHIIYTIDGPRLAKVLKTVAWIVVGDDNGPVTEKWALKQHRNYDTQWVRA